jgi:RNA 2',3'-cyclic 3'-phosphodiesterase
VSETKPSGHGRLEAGRRSQGPRTRLFVALELPEEIRGLLARWGGRHLAKRGGLRIVPPDNLHVTLCFLGWREESEVESLGALVAACAEPVADLGLGPPVWLPRRRPRVLAVELEDGGGALAALQARVADKLEAQAGYQRESRPYRPHVTVARVPSRVRLTRADQELPETPTSAPFEGTAVTLYRSRLRRDGAVYEPAVRASLAG